MRINLTKKEIVNSMYMQLGFPKKVCENLYPKIIFNKTTYQMFVTHDVDQPSRFSCISRSLFIKRYLGDLLNS